MPRKTRFAARIGPARRPLRVARIQPSDYPQQCRVSGFHDLAARPFFSSHSLLPFNGNVSGATVRFYLCRFELNCLSGYRWYYRRGRYPVHLLYISPHLAAFASSVSSRRCSRWQATSLLGFPKIFPTYVSLGDYDEEAVRRTQKTHNALESEAVSRYRQKVG